MKGENRIKSSLSMIDEISLRRMSNWDYEQIQDLIKPEIILVNQTTIDPNTAEQDYPFKSGDVSINKTYVDGSVIIHTGNKPFNINTSQLGVLDASGYDINAYYGMNEKQMTTQLNISTFDNPNISKVDVLIQNNNKLVETQQSDQDRPVLSTLEALKKKARESREFEEAKLKQVHAVSENIQPEKKEIKKIQQKKTENINLQAQSFKPVNIKSDIQKGFETLRQKKDVVPISIKPNLQEHIQNNKQNCLMNYLAKEDDIELNQEWIKLFEETEKQLLQDIKPNSKQQTSKKDIIILSRK